MTRKTQRNEFEQNKTTLDRQMRPGEAPSYPRPWTGQAAVDKRQTKVLIKAFCSSLALRAMQEIIALFPFMKPNMRQDKMLTFLQQ